MDANYEKKSKKEQMVVRGWSTEEKSLEHAACAWQQLIHIMCFESDMQRAPLILRTLSLRLSWV